MKYVLASKELHVGMLLALSQTSIMRDPVLTFTCTCIYEETSLQYVLFNWIELSNKIICKLLFLCHIISPNDDDDTNWRCFYVH